MSLLLETTSSCVSPFPQLAAEEAISSTQDYVTQMIDTFRRRRDLLHDLIRELPLVSAKKPEGAFYTFVNIKKTGLSDVDFCESLLSECRVAACPGSFFGHGGEGYVRFCFATDESEIVEGMTRLKSFLQNLEVKLAK